MADDGEKKAQKPLTFAGLTALAHALDSKQAHTSFGKLPMSIEKSAPEFGFSKAKRDDGNKIFISEELAKTNAVGKGTPGPGYVYEDKNKYQAKPAWGFGTQPKEFGAKPKYDFYENTIFFDDPAGADASRKAAVLAPKIGTEPRMPLPTSETTPGPQYYPNLKPEIKNSQKYTFGYRRQGKGGVLTNQTSTPGSVGPGRYVPEASSNPSTKTNMPRWTLPKAGRPANDRRPIDKN